MTKVNLTRVMVAGVLALLLVGTALASACSKPAPSPTPAATSPKPTAAAPKPTAAKPAASAKPTAAPTSKPAAPSAWTPPKLILFSAPNISSASFLSTQAMVAAIGKKTGVTFKLQSEAVGMTRFALVKKGDVQFSTQAGTDQGEAWAGVLGYNTKGLGPQQVRAIWLGQPTYVGLMTPATAKINSVADLKGKKVSYYEQSQPGVHNNMTAFLAFGNVSWNDVTKVPVSGSDEGRKAVVQGQTDAGFSPTNSSQAYELEASSRGVKWVPFPLTDKAGWERLQKIVPFYAAASATVGAGVSKERPVDMPAHYITLSCYDSQDENLVYWMTKQITESYQDYKSAYAGLELNTVDNALDINAITTPYHRGAIKYFKEIGRWTPDLEKKNNDLLAREKAMRADWEKLHPGW